MIRCHHRNVTDRPQYAIDDPSGHWYCYDCGDTFPLIGDTDMWRPKFVAWNRFKEWLGSLIAE